MLIRSEKHEEIYLKLHRRLSPENSWEEIIKYDSYFAGATYCADINQFIKALNAD